MINEELSAYFGPKFKKGNKINTFMKLILTCKIRYGKLDILDVLKIYKTKFSKEYELYNLQGFYLVLRILEEKELIKFPRRKSDWNIVKLPVLPNWIQVDLENSDEKTIKFWKTYPWVPELAWISSLNSLSFERFELLKILNEKLNDHKFIGSPLMAEKERSIELFQNEKILGVMAKNYEKDCPSFMELCHAKSTYEPLTYYEFSNSNANFLIIENRDTFYSLNKIFSELDQSPFKYLVYGRGTEIISNFAQLFDLEIGNLVIQYFGDIDHGGFGIFYKLKKDMTKFKEKRKFEWKLSIQPFHLLYEKLIEINELNEWIYPDNKIGRMSLSCFEGVLEENINKYLEKGLRIPQEILNYQRLKPLFSPEKYEPQIENP